MDILSIIQAISDFLGLDFASLLASAAAITVLINFLKSTAPFKDWVTGSRIPYITGGIAVIISLVTLWGLIWWQILSAAVLITVLSVGGWATAKMLVHKIGTQPTNKSGGKK